MFQIKRLPESRVVCDTSSQIYQKTYASLCAKIRFSHLLRTLADVAIDCISPSSRNMQECIFGKNVACAHLGSFEHERVHAAKSN